ncbi:MAG: phosphate regulon sensor histidine kinase PhoR [Coxiellaceae bacterium]|nr:phosphate regulon sensor histidine kinase PhoR [Coxiellaceae bacterium]
MTEQDLAEALSDGIVCLQRDGQCVWWNSAAEGLLKLEQLPSYNNITKIIPNVKFRRYFKRQPFNEVLELPSPSYTNRQLIIHLRPYDDHLLLVVRDVTHTHHLNSMRQDFIANVSHELRTPLTVFHGYLEILQDNDLDDPILLRDILQQMQIQSRRMEGLVRDLLLLSRLEGDEPDIAQHQQVNLAGLLRIIIDDAKALSGKKNHHFAVSLDEDIEVEGHSEELHSAFSNIIFNAVHYTPENGEIQIDLYKDGDDFTVRVKDNGIGIAEEQIPKLTQRFYRVDEARSRDDSRRGGTGLGLAIVKHVLLRHHGELLIDSEPGVGSTFYCRFPVSL